MIVQVNIPELVAESIFVTTTLTDPQINRCNLIYTHAEYTQILQLTAGSNLGGKEKLLSSQPKFKSFLRHDCYQCTSNLTIAYVLEGGRRCFHASRCPVQNPPGLGALLYTDKFTRDDIHESIPLISHKDFLGREKQIFVASKTFKMVL